MEPITTLIVYSVLLTPALETAAPKWGIEANESTKRVVAERVNYVSPEYIAVGAGGAIYTFSQNQFLSQTSRIVSILQSYRNLGDNWGDDGSAAPQNESIEAAIQLIEAIPAGIELPSPMISYEGEVGFYWNSPTGYISIDVESKERASLYVLNRETGTDHFEDSIALAQCDRNWYENLLGALKPQTGRAAA